MCTVTSIDDTEVKILKMLLENKNKKINRTYTLYIYIVINGLYR